MPLVYAERQELEELRTMRKRTRRFRREAASFAEAINRHRNANREQSQCPTNSDLRSEWKIIINALRYGAMHGVIHEDIALILAKTIGAILDGRLPKEFERPAFRPTNDYARPEWIATAQLYAAAARIKLIDDENYRSTIDKNFVITRQTRDRWLGPSKNRDFVDQFLLTALESHRQAVAILGDSLEIYDQVMQSEGCGPARDWTFPSGMSPDEIREKMLAAAKAYDTRRREHRK